MHLQLHLAHLSSLYPDLCFELAHKKKYNSNYSLNKMQNINHVPCLFLLSAVLKASSSLLDWSLNSIWS